MTFAVLVVDTTTFPKLRLVGETVTVWPTKNEVVKLSSERLLAKKDASSNAPRSDSAFFRSASAVTAAPRPVWCLKRVGRQIAARFQSDARIITFPL